MKRFFIYSLFFTLSVQVALAKKLDGIAVWKPLKDGPRILVPVLEGDSLRGSVERYLDNFYKNPDMKDLLRRHKFKKSWLAPDNITKLNHKQLKYTFKPGFLFMANQLTDYAPKNFRIDTFFGPMKFHGADNYLLPVAHDLGLSRKEAKAYRGLLTETFDVLFGMGGEDVHPRMYGSRISHANVDELNLTRDKAELKIIRQWNNAKKGVYYGVCRGEQICGVERGEKVIQDLAKDGVTDEHWLKWHSVALSKEKDNLLRAFVDFKDDIEIASLHHQAIAPLRENSPLKVVASEGAGKNYVVESIQFKNQLGLAVQFHPELMNTDDGDAILKGMVQYARFVKRLRLTKTPCNNLIELFLKSR